MEKQSGTHILPAWVGVWEMPTNVAESGCPQKGVGDRMEETIPIGMPEGAFFKGECDTPQEELPSRNQPMDVISSSNSHMIFLAFTIAEAIVRSSGVVIFILVGLPSINLIFISNLSLSLSTSIASSVPIN